MVASSLISLPLRITSPWEVVPLLRVPPSVAVNVVTPRFSFALPDMTNWRVESA